MTSFETWQLNIKGNTQISVPANLNSMTAYVLLEQEDWFEKETNFMRKFLDPDMKCLDIGACYGVYGRTMANAVANGGKVYCFEPDRFAEKHLAHNKPANLEVFVCGLSDHPGKSSLSKNQPELRKTVTGKDFDTTTLDIWWENAGRPEIDLIKLDTNGCETQIIEGGIDFLSQTSPGILFSVKIEGQFNHQILQSFMNKAFDIYQYIPGPGILARFDPDANDDPYLLNLFAVKRNLMSKVQDKGLLVSEDLPMSKPDSGFWEQHLLSLPWTASMFPVWKKHLHKSENNYLEALDLVCAAQEPQAIPAQRFIQLRCAAKKLKEIHENRASTHVTITLARTLQALGLRRQAVKILETLIENIQSGIPVEFNAPFLTPLPEFDNLRVKDTAENWIAARCIESLIFLRSYSSYFSAAQDQNLFRTLSENPECSLECQRRLILSGDIESRKPWISPESGLLADECVNAHVWKQIISAEPTTGSRTSQSKNFPASSLNRPVQDDTIRDLTPSSPITIHLEKKDSIRIASFGKTTNALVGKSEDGQYFVKIELVRHPDKRNNLLAESEIIKDLNEKNCVSCPELFGTGYVEAKELAGIMNINRLSEKLPALVLPYIETQNEVPINDLLFSIEEQRKLGWFCADIKPDNILFCPKTQICYIVDYDQAEPLPKEQIDQPLVDFLRWADLRVREKYAKFNFNGLFNYFPGISVEKNILPHLRNGRLDLGGTKLLTSAETTLNKTKIYHSIDLPDIVAQGERTLDARIKLMERISFLPGERVLDIGCNSGLLCAYLASKGCMVSGFDLDPYVIRAARMLSNIRGDDINFACVDLDKAQEIDTFDTIMLFSVLHHTQKVPINARLIADACNRIIIECRLLERGAKPVNGKWINTTNWSYASLDEMIRGLEEYFPGFVLVKNHGQADRDRYVLEFSRKGADLKQGNDPLPVQEKIPDVSEKEFESAPQKQNNSLDTATFRDFLQNNGKRWSAIAAGDPDKCILVELLVSHPAYFIANAVLAKYLQQIYGCSIKAVLPSRKIQFMKALAQSYGINDFYYEEDLYKHVSGEEKNLVEKNLQNVKNEEELRRTVLNLTIRGICVGDLIYDAYLRSTGNVTIDSVNQQLVGYVTRSFAYYRFYSSIFKKNNIIATAVGHTVYDRFGILSRVSVARGTPVFAKKPNPLVIRRYKNITEFPGNESSFDREEFQFVWQNKRKEAIKVGRKIMRKKMSSDGKTTSGGDFSRDYTQGYSGHKRILSKEQFCEAIRIDPGKPIVILFSHVFPEATHNYARRLFEDYYQWLVQTLDYVVHKKDVNWIVKPHPDDKFYGSKLSAEDVYTRYADYNHIALSPPDINNLSFFEFTQAIVTVCGNAGLEFSWHGIPAILAGESNYSDHGFTHDAKTLAEYYRLLDTVQKIPRLQKRDIDKAYVLNAISRYYSRASCVYMPVMPLTPWEEFNFKEVYQEASERVKKYDFREDPFFRALASQIALNDKHLFNFGKLPSFFDE